MTAAAAPAATSPADEAVPLRFVLVPERAHTLPPLEQVVLIALLRFCWDSPYCWPSQETLAQVIGQPRANVVRGLRGLVERGAITKAYKRDLKGRHCAYTISPDYWVSKNPRVSATMTTCGHKEDSTYKKKKTPVAPAGAGEAAPVFAKESEGCAGEGDSVHRHLEPGEQCRHCGHQSTRRTPYGQPRAPRRPRPSRQRQRKQSLYDAFMAIAARDQTTAAPPARPALPPPPDIIPPGHQFVAGEVIPMPHEPLPRPRGFSPATDILEAFHYAAAKSEERDRTERRNPACPLLATG